MSNSKIRWSSIAEPETPPAARVYMWYDESDQIFKIKRDDGVAEPLIGGSIVTNTITLKCLVRNITGATIPKKSAVYINGASGNRPTINYSQANSESTSSKTFGVTESDILHNGVGYVVVEGQLQNVDTTMFTEGQLLWLSPTTPGGFTTTKPSAPNHMVFCGYVVRSHPTEGIIEVKIQNGFELNELHNVAIDTPTNKQALAYDTITALWKNVSLVVDTMAGTQTDVAPSVQSVKTYVANQIATSNVVEYFQLDASEMLAKAVTLSNTPAIPQYVMLDVIGGGPQVYAEDFSVTGASLSWNGLALDGILSEGDKLRVSYFK
jgi:hypothetical protein